MQSIRPSFLQIAKMNFSLIITVLVLLQSVCGCALLPAEYKTIENGGPVVLPRDMYMVPDYQVQWWYYTGHLTSEEGKEFGFELVFFIRRTEQDRVLGIPVYNYSTPAHMAHFAITDLQSKNFSYSDIHNKDFFTRNGNAGALRNSLCIWNGDWSVKEIGNLYYLKASMPQYDLSLALTPKKPPILHGNQGRFIKAARSDKQAGTFYITIPRFEAEGTLFVEQKPYKVTGSVWMDREFGTHQLAKDQIGWDWFGIQLDNGTDLMIYLLKRKDGSYETQTSCATWIEPDGTSRTIPFSKIKIEKLKSWTSPRTDTEYTVQWRIKIEPEDLEMTIIAVLNDQEIDSSASTMIKYWEGKMTVNAMYRGKEIKGKAYLEMCGNAHPITYLSSFPALKDQKS